MDNLATGVHEIPNPGRVRSAGAVSATEARQRGAREGLLWAVQGTGPRERAELHGKWNEHDCHEVE